MFSNERKTGNDRVCKPDGFHLVDRVHVVEPNRVEHELQIRIFKLTAVCFGDDEIFDLMP